MTIARARERKRRATSLFGVDGRVQALVKTKEARLLTATRFGHKDQLLRRTSYAQASSTQRAHVLTHVKT
eukprot:3670565-Pleurochrysis_carterae.AAC.1